MLLIPPSLISRFVSFGGAFTTTLEVLFGLLWPVIKGPKAPSRIQPNRSGPAAPFAPAPAVRKQDTKRGAKSQQGLKFLFRGRRQHDDDDDDDDDANADDGANYDDDVAAGSETDYVYEQ